MFERLVRDSATGRVAVTTRLNRLLVWVLHAMLLISPGLGIACQCT